MKATDELLKQIKELNIENEDVVEKSYPEFWEDFAKVTTS